MGTQIHKLQNGGLLIFRRSKGTDQQMMKNGCRVKYVRFNNEPKYEIGTLCKGTVATVLQRHGKYEHDGAIAELLSQDSKDKLKAETAKLVKQGIDPNTAKARVVLGIPARSTILRTDTTETPMYPAPEPKLVARKARPFKGAR